MCGITSSFNFDPHEMRNIISKLELRGRDGVGVFIQQLRNKSTIRIKEEEKSSTIKNRISVIESNSVILANSRATPSTEYATGSGFSVENQQPFENDRYVVVHNGLIYNDKELIKQYTLSPSSSVDSAILPELFSKLGVLKGLSQINGSYAIVCFDKLKEKLYVAKNFLPLYWVKMSDGVAFFSLKEMIDSKYHHLTMEVEPYTCLEFQLHKDISKYTMNKYTLYPTTKNNKVLVICSGGADSVTTAMLYHYLGYEVGLLHFNLGQAAETQEQRYVEILAEKYDWKILIYNATEIFKPFKAVSKLLYQKVPKSDESQIDAESDLSYIPARNLIFTAIGAGVAEMLGYDTLSYGGNQEDGGAYPDNGVPYFESLKKTLKYSLKQNTNVEFTSPLINMIKWEIVSLGKKIGVDYDEVVSCYYPRIVNNKLQRCHTCGCCLYLDNAMNMSKEKDIGDVDTFITKYLKGYI